MYLKKGLKINNAVSIIIEFKSEIVVCADKHEAMRGIIARCNTVYYFTIRYFILLHYIWHCYLRAILAKDKANCLSPNRVMAESDINNEYLNGAASKMMIFVIIVTIAMRLRLKSLLASMRCSCSSFIYVACRTLSQCNEMMSPKEWWARQEPNCHFIFFIIRASEHQSVRSAIQIASTIWIISRRVFISVFPFAIVQLAPIFIFVENFDAIDWGKCIRSSLRVFLLPELHLIFMNGYVIIKFSQCGKQLFIFDVCTYNGHWSGLELSSQHNKNGCPWHHVLSDWMEWNSQSHKKGEK